MLKAWLVVALCSAAFAESITFNYTGTPFVRCSDNCPANFTSDFNIASFTFSASLAGNLSSANELTSPNLTAWTIGDALRLGPAPGSYSSTDPNAATELVKLMLSTDSSGGIVGWGIEAPTFAPGTGVPFFAMQNPTVIGKGSGLPNADDFVNTSSQGFAMGNSIPGSWTESLNGFQGGTMAAPVFLLGGSPVGEVNGTISGQGSQDYYFFNWAGGTFSATASITGAPAGASYLFSEGVAGNCNSSNATLNSGDSFTGTIAFANLSPGQYCIGLDANNPNDPNFVLTFNTPVSGVPEPSGLVLLAAGLGVIGVLRYAKHDRQHS